MAVDDKAEMMAAFLVDKEVESYYASEQLKKMEKQRRDMDRNSSPNRRKTR